MIILPEDSHLMNLFWDDYSTERQPSYKLLLEWLFYQKTAILWISSGMIILPEDSRLIKLFWDDYSTWRQPTYKPLLGWLFYRKTAILLTFSFRFFFFISTNDLWRHLLRSWCFVFRRLYSPLLTTCAINRDINELCTLSAQYNFCFVWFPQ
jgi:hypothetical protein